MKKVGMKLLLRCSFTTILLLIGMGLISIPNTAFASSSPCYASNCTGHDPYVAPYKAVCTNNHQTIVAAYAKSNGQTVATVWNHYSIDCKANWAEYQLTSYGLSHGCGFTVAIGDLASGTPISSYSYSGPYVAWTNMIDGTPKTFADISGNCYATGIPPMLYAEADQ